MATLDGCTAAQLEPFIGHTAEITWLHGDPEATTWIPVARFTGTGTISWVRSHGPNSPRPLVRFISEDLWHGGIVQKLAPANIARIEALDGRDLGPSLDELDAALIANH